MQGHFSRHTARLAALLAATAVAGTGFSSSASAAPVDPTKKLAGCEWGGLGYSHGGKHTESHKRSDGGTDHVEYVCNNGVWEFSRSWSTAKPAGKKPRLPVAPIGVLAPPNP